MADKLKELLKGNSVSSLAPPKKGVIQLDSTAQVVQGFQKLLDNNILSAPVWDVKEGKYIGFLDIRDLVSFCVFIHDNNLEAESLLDIVNFGAKMFKHATDGVTLPYLARRNPVHAVKHTASLHEVVEILTKGGVRRVPVVDDAGKVINIVSQSSIIQFINKHLNDIKPLFEEKLEDLPIGNSPVLAVSKETRAIDVFRMMDQHNRSGVAVVDPTGSLLGYTSGPDLKLFIQTPSLGVLQLPIMTFLNQIRCQSIDIATPVTTCSLHEPAKILIGKLVATRAHRVFIVTNDYKPSKVVSIVDLLRYILEKTK
jgi:5'-AMP-activated protein kinase regulatory gamma subunit